MTSSGSLFTVFKKITRQFPPPGRKLGSGTKLGDLKTDIAIEALVGTFCREKKSVFIKLYNLSTDCEQSSQIMRPLISIVVI